MNPQMASITELGTPWDEPWLEDGLETLDKCPVCSETNRSILHTDLVDNTFHCAPGFWQLWQCAKCRSAYLDPRPTPETIGAAYQEYYTHKINKSKLDYDKLTWPRQQRRKIVNGYKNRRFRTSAAPASRLGYYLISCFPPLRRRLDREYRNLPKQRPKDATLLDLGCGSGEFLLSAKSCGWQVVGIDPDIRAVKEAQSMGLDARLGSISIFDKQDELFDVIVMSHVIEHLHDPINVLGECYRLLKPGGYLWIETPNIDAKGQLMFGRNWRGLEAPRHLVLFNVRSLRKSLKKIGFQTIKREIRSVTSLGIFRESLAIEENRAIHDPVIENFTFQMRRWIAVLSEIVRPTTHEVITVSAQKKWDLEG